MNSSSIMINRVLSKGGNSFNTLRLLLAYSVIIGHAVSLNGISSFYVDPILSLFKVEHLHTLAVKIFLFISGLLITNSMLTNGDAQKYIISRVFRIVPGLMFLLVVTAYFIGPTLTAMTLGDYMKNGEVFAYLHDNLLLTFNFILPGVFEENIYKDAVNGSLWTLSYEVSCYCFVLGAYLIFRGFKHSKIFFNGISIVIILDTIFNNHSFFPFLGGNPDVYYLPMMFSFGAILAINKDTISIKMTQCLGLFIMYYLFSSTESAHWILLLAISMLVVVLFSGQRLELKVLKIDISYGVYLWGFLVQQILYSLFGHMVIHVNILLSIIITSIIAYVSAVYIEIPAIKQGMKLNDFICSARREFNISLIINKLYSAFKVSSIKRN